MYLDGCSTCFHPAVYVLYWSKFIKYRYKSSLSEGQQWFIKLPGAVAAIHGPIRKSCAVEQRKWLVLSGSSDGGESRYIWNVFCSRTNKTCFLIGCAWVVVLIVEIEYSRMTRLLRWESLDQEPVRGKNKEFCLGNVTFEMSFTHLSGVRYTCSSRLEIRIWETDICKSLTSFSDVRLR